ncbi:hypothetical protein CDEF62S_03665 [Castellaniella defragrans]
MREGLSGRIWEALFFKKWHCPEDPGLFKETRALLAGITVAAALDLLHGVPGALMDQKSHWIAGMEEA